MDFYQANPPEYSANQIQVYSTENSYELKIEAGLSCSAAP